MTEKAYLMIIVSYETAGGHGEHDAIEEGFIERMKLLLRTKLLLPQKFKVEVYQSLETEEAERLIRD